MKSFKLKSTVALLVALFLFANNTFAQDKIYKKNNNEPILANVIEIGTGEIKYKLLGEEEDGLIYVLDKMMITKVEFENGRTEKFGPDRIDVEEYFAGQKRRNLKVSFFGPLVGTTKFTYEQVIKPGRSWEAKMAIVGLGLSDISDDTGLFGSVAYKFYRKPTFVTSDMRRRNIFQGAYLKPEFFFGGHSDNYGSERKSNVTSAGLLLNLGMQWVFADRIVVDTHFGAGYGTGESYNGYFVYDNRAMGAGINVGFTF